VSDSKILFRAGHVAPITQPVIRDGAIVAVDGEIVAVGPAHELLREHPDATILDRPDCTIVPGLVNPHTHLELSGLSCGSPPASFESWLLKLVPHGVPDMDAMRESAARSIPIGVKQCLQFGVTTVGDISRQCTVTRPLLSRGPIRVISFGEVQAMASRRGLLEERITTAIDSSAESKSLRIGLSPHAPYSVEFDGYRRCVEVARSRGIPLTTHLAESHDEAQFLATHEGPFRELWMALKGWDDQVPQFVGGPIRFAKAAGLLNYPTVLAHVNYCDDDELKLLSESQASVVYCPRTHAYFGHPPHRWRNMLTAGINVAIGTDSCASSPNLNLLDDLRLAQKLAPDWPILELWKLVTTRAAGALGVADLAGSLEVGKHCDLVMFDTESDNPLAEILSKSIEPCQVWIGGKRVGVQIP
jgi:cytosine/adenosine deaminase-related metal-dependent hydrolase